MSLKRLLHLLCDLDVLNPSVLASLELDIVNISEVLSPCNTLVAKVYSPKNLAGMFFHKIAKKQVSMQCGYLLNLHLLICHFASLPILSTLQTLVFANVPICPCANLPTCPSADLSICQFANYANAPICRSANLLFC